MTIIQFGSLAILLKWVLLAVAIVFSLIYIRIWLKHSLQKEAVKRIFDLIGNSLILGFFSWKGSLLILEPSLIINSPFSLLYFTGGTNGLMLAVVIAAVYFIYKGNKVTEIKLFLYKTMVIFSFVVLTVYHILSFAFLDDLNVVHLILGCYSIIIVFGIMINKPILTMNMMIGSTIVFSFLTIILSFTIIKNSPSDYIFSFQQWFYFVLIVVLLYYWNKQSKLSNKA